MLSALCDHSCARDALHNAHVHSSMCQEPAALLCKALFYKWWQLSLSVAMWCHMLAAPVSSMQRDLVAGSCFPSCHAASHDMLFRVPGPFADTAPVAFAVGAKVSIE